MALPPSPAPFLTLLIIVLIALKCMSQSILASEKAIYVCNQRILEPSPSCFNRKFPV